MVKTALNPQTKFTFSVLLLFISLAAVIAGFYFLRQISADVRWTKIKIEETKRDIALLDKIHNEKKLYGSDIQKVKNTLPAEYYEVSFFTGELERLAQNNNLTLEVNADNNKKEEKETYNSIIYSLQMGGSYSSVAGFLDQMAKLPYHTSVDYIKMITDEGILLTDVKFRLFVEK